MTDETPRHSIPESPELAPPSEPSFGKELASPSEPVFGKELAPAAPMSFDAEDEDGPNRNLRVDTAADGSPVLANPAQERPVDQTVNSVDDTHSDRLTEPEARAADEASRDMRDHALELSDSFFGKRESVSFHHKAADMIEDWAVRLHRSPDGLNQELLQTRPELAQKLNGKEPSEQARILAQVEYEAAEKQKEVEDYLAKAEAMRQQLEESSGTLKFLSDITRAAGEPAEPSQVRPEHPQPSPDQFADEQAKQWSN